MSTSAYRRDHESNTDLIVIQDRQILVHSPTLLLNPLLHGLNHFLSRQEVFPVQIHSFPRIFVKLARDFALVDSELATLVQLGGSTRARQVYEHGWTEAMNRIKTSQYW